MLGTYSAPVLYTNAQYQFYYTALSLETITVMTKWHV